RKKMWLAAPILTFGVCSSWNIANAQFFGFDKVIQNEIQGTSLVSDMNIGLTRLKPVSGNLGFVGNSGLLEMRSALSDLGLHPLVSLRESEHFKPTGLGLEGGTSILDVKSYEYLVHGFPVCLNQIKSIQNANQDTVFVGSLPQIDQVVYFESSNWPDLAQTISYSVEQVAAVAGVSASGAKVLRSKQCLYNEQGFLEPAYSMIVSAHGLQYDVIGSSSRVYSLNPRYFDIVSGTIQAHDTNSTTGALTNFSVNLDGSGNLTNDYFKSSIATGDARSSSSSHSFTYPGSLTVNYAEAANFAYVNRHLDFAIANGYSWKGPKPITVEVRATVRGTVNNALYTPSDGVSAPMIQVGQGDGAILQKLEFDSDVVSHEFGHHIVYQSITDIGGEALVLHEGLADFLTFARSGDACLGESICPSGTTMSSCKLASNRCLRTADNTLVYGQSPYTGYTSAPHIQGQIVSGYLWDLRKNNSIPSDTLTKYVMQAITYLPARAEIKNLVAAMLYVDSQNKSTYATVLESAGAARGLSASSLGIDMSNLQSSISSPGATSTEETKKKKSFLGCATINGNQQNLFGGFSTILFVLAIPLLFALSPKKQPVSVQKNKTR
ncbi:MAG: hypothetical protein NT027_18820, partial [Proteobacteria bacterium]|nr:hypothetical protein [Pseudomonadota bacterium]